MVRFRQASAAGCCSDTLKGGLVTHPVHGLLPVFAPRHYRIGGGAKEDRTPDLLRARQALSQLSYGPSVAAEFPSPHRACMPRPSLYASI